MQLHELCYVHTHTHTNKHLRIHNLKKGVSENEAPGPIGAYTTNHNHSPTPIQNRCRSSFTESQSPNRIHKAEMRISQSPNLILRIAEMRISLAGCRGCIGRRRHPETQSNTCTYGTKRNTYVHAYIRKDGKWRKRMQRGKSEKRKPPRARRKKYLTIENGRGGLDATPWTV